MHTTNTLLKTIPILILAFSLQPAWADSDPDIPGSDTLFDALVSDDLLAGQRGKALIPTNTNNLDGAVYDNAASDLVTGFNMVSDGSLANNAGLNTVIQNSGNNVLIQNAVILNIQMQ
ncbi:hypothetical protein [Thiobacillus sp.]|uniref:hypothetical protein n=1 Tax=Thiobacillus sp. TaxID=924 RepID=UPI00286D775C|nr:hypothetical protein [Thiobacillus sp.]